MESNSSKIVPFLPFWSTGGNKKISEWEEPFDDGAGHTGTATWVLFEDKKGNQHQVFGRIKWDN